MILTVSHLVLEELSYSLFKIKSFVHLVLFSPIKSSSIFSKPILHRYGARLENLKIHKIEFLRAGAYSLVKENRQYEDGVVWEHGRGTGHPAWVLACRGGQGSRQPRSQVGGRQMNGGEGCPWQRDQHGTGPEAWGLEYIPRAAHNWR